LLDAVKTILNGEEHEITVRHLFYRLVSVKAIEKTEEEYQIILIRTALPEQLGPAFVYQSGCHGRKHVSQSGIWTVR